MNKSIQQRCSISGWAALLGVSVWLISPLSFATTVDHGLAERIYQAIEQTQTTDPESYITTFDYQGPNGETLRQLKDGQASSAVADSDTQAAAESCSGVPTQGKVYGSAMLDGEVLDYELDFHDLLLKADYKGRSYDIPAKDMIGFQGKEGWPCAVPVAAIICGVTGGAYCGWRVSQCYRAAERCPCGVEVYNCGVCGEGGGVVCAECAPPEPDTSWLRPGFGGGFGWGF